MSNLEKQNILYCCLLSFCTYLISNRDNRKTKKSWFFQGCIIHQDESAFLSFIFRSSPIRCSQFGILNFFGAGFMKNWEPFFGLAFQSLQVNKNFSSETFNRRHSQVSIKVSRIQSRQRQTISVSGQRSS